MANNRTTVAQLEAEVVQLNAMLVALTEQISALDKRMSAAETTCTTAEKAFVWLRTKFGAQPEVKPAAPSKTYPVDNKKAQPQPQPKPQAQSTTTRRDFRRSSSAKAQPANAPSGQLSRAEYDKYIDAVKKAARTSKSGVTCLPYAQAQAMTLDNLMATLR